MLEDSLYQQLTGLENQDEEDINVNEQPILEDDERINQKLEALAEQYILINISNLSRKAVAIIWRAWKKYSMVRTFKWVKLYLTRMEKALTNEVLKRLSPNEGILLKDVALQARVRFRYKQSCY